ncbi:hypothetical protein VTN02DRAFT_2468 [Thermoascus thermophilus]
MNNHPEPPFSDLDIYFVFGGPGAGKGTICARLAQELGLAHVCVGDLLRAEMERCGNDYPALKPVKQAMEEGRLAPIWAIRMVLMDKLCETKRTVVLLDGFPRSLEQMEMFQRSFGGAKCGLLFSCSQETMERRVLNRSQTSNRVDDNLETLRQRFRQHDEETMPCVDRLRERNELVEFHCDGDLDAVYEVVKSKFQELQRKDKKNKPE